MPCLRRSFSTGQTLLSSGKHSLFDWLLFRSSREISTNLSRTGHKELLMLVRLMAKRPALVCYSCFHIGIYVPPLAF